MRSSEKCTQTHTEHNVWQSVAKLPINLCCDCSLWWLRYKAKGVKQIKTLSTAHTEKLWYWNLDTYIMSVTSECAYISTKFIHHSPVLLILGLETYTAIADVHKSTGALKFRQWQIWWYFIFAMIVCYLLVQWTLLWVQQNALRDHKYSSDYFITFSKVKCAITDKRLMANTLFCWPITKSYLHWKYCDVRFMPYSPLLLQWTWNNITKKVPQTFKGYIQL